MTNTKTTCIRAALTLSLSLGTSAAWAQTATDAPAPEHARDLGNHQRHLRIDVGVRTQFVRSKGFDPFASNDVLPQLTLAASYYFWAHERFSLGAVVGFDYGARSDSARSGDTSLDSRRFLLAPELRYHVLRVLALSAKVGPTLTRQEVTYSGGLAGDLAKTAWKAGFDATAGAAFEVFGYSNPQSNKPRLWLTAEGGYGWTAANRLRLEPEDSSPAPQRLTPLDLGQLSLSGPLFRVTAAVSFW
ncbi:MAG: hypothetical protein EOO73_28820 [Myxococcales bacterium]|nr:MAG: hypothetical protein EOO73_28820 [Myxococcales bacterium]